MRMSIGALAPYWALLRDTASAWIGDYASSMGAALSYYTLFSLAPFLLIVISVAGMVFGADAARGEIFAQLHSLLGKEGAIAIEGLLQSVDASKHGALGTLAGAGLLLLGATSVFSELQSALDRIWRAPARPKVPGWWNLLRSRLLSIGLILAIGFLLMVSLVVSAGLEAWSRWWAPAFGGWQTIAWIANLLLSLALMTTLFALIYKFMPRARVAWKDVWIGAIVTATLFTIGKQLIGLYIGRVGVASGFGAASSIVIVLIWVYYSAQLFLAGAEFTWVYAHRFGSRRGRW